MENHTSITFIAKVHPIKPVNSEFDLCKIYVQSCGKNRNGTYMSKESIETFLPTLNYCPVVGHIIECKDEDGNIHRYMGSHDYEITDDWELKSLTVPYGVVVADSYDFEIVSEYGIDVEYLTANAILWTGRYPELKECIYSDDIWFNQSMEINVGEGKHRPLEEDSNYTEILEWEYSALCMLGKADPLSTNGHTDKKEHSEPCFISSRIVPTEFSKSEFAELMNEMKEKIAFCLNQSSTTVAEMTMEVDIKNHNGGSTMTEEIKNEVVEEVTEPVVEEVVEETPADVTEETFEENPEDVVEETPNEVAENEEPKIEETVTEETTEEVEDPVVEESDEDYSLLYAELKKEYDALNEEFSAYKADNSFLISELESLRQYKKDKEFEERKCAEESLFAEYEGRIGKTTEFKALKEKSSEFSLDELKKECLCIVGMHSMTETNQVIETPKSEPLKFSLEAVEVDEEPYGGLFKKYLNK